MAGSPSPPYGASSPRDSVQAPAEPWHGLGHAQTISTVGDRWEVSPPHS